MILLLSLCRTVGSCWFSCSLRRYNFDTVNVDIAVYLSLAVTLDLSFVVFGTSPLVFFDLFSCQCGKLPFGPWFSFILWYAWIEILFDYPTILACRQGTLIWSSTEIISYDQDLLRCLMSYGAVFISLRKFSSLTYWMIWLFFSLYARSNNYDSDNDGCSSVLCFMYWLDACFSYFNATVESCPSGWTPYLAANGWASWPLNATYYFPSVTIEY